jgi:copper chaperone NosL
MNRRSVLMLGLCLGWAAGCDRGVRCSTCGMKIDPRSAWVSYLEGDGKELAFDTPRCAFRAWRAAGAGHAKARFREYYSQQIRSADELKFVAGSDIVGPMGPDLVPVESGAKALQFARDHNGAPPKGAADILREESP